jgi:hypothetical protein
MLAEAGPTAHPIAPPPPPVRQQRAPPHHHSYWLVRSTPSPSLRRTAWKPRFAVTAADRLRQPPS